MTNFTAKPRKKGELIWSGEHWMVYLRREGSEKDTAMVSLYHAYISPAGRGTAAFVQTDGDDGFKGFCTDNEDFAQFVRETQIGAYTPYDVDMPVVPAELIRGGDILNRPTWTIAAQGREIVTTWSELDAPIVGLPKPHPTIAFTILIFSDGGTIAVDGKTASGMPYLRDGWIRSLGEAKSSCCFALSETMVQA